MLERGGWSQIKSNYSICCKIQSKLPFPATDFNGQVCWCFWEHTKYFFSSFENRITFRLCCKQKSLQENPAKAGSCFLEHEGWLFLNGLNLKLAGERWWTSGSHGERAVFTILTSVTNTFKYTMLKTDLRTKEICFILSEYDLNFGQFHTQSNQMNSGDLKYRTQMFFWAWQLQSLSFLCLLNRKTSGWVNYRIFYFAPAKQPLFLFILDTIKAIFVQLKWSVLYIFFNSCYIFELLTTGMLTLLWLAKVCNFCAIKITKRNWTSNDLLLSGYDGWYFPANRAMFW